jgi:hypothetical protein
MKFSKNSRKLFLNFYIKNGTERHLGHPRGTHHATTPHGGAVQARPRHGMVWGLLALHLFFHLPLHSLSRKNSTPLLKPMFLLFLLVIFDLLAQPIFAAEIWSICALVCDSFDCQSRILFSGVFLEYFSTIGDRLNEFAYLFYCLEKLLWCMLALLQLPIVVPSFVCLKIIFMRFVKKFRDGGEWISTHPTWIRVAWSHESPPSRGSLPLYLSMLGIHECCVDSVGLPNSNL